MPSARRPRGQDAGSQQLVIRGARPAGPTDGRAKADGVEPTTAEPPVAAAAPVVAPVATPAVAKPTATLPKPYAIHEVLEAFALIDSNGDGMLSRDELHVAHGLATKHHGGGTTTATVDASVTTAPPTAAVAVVASPAVAVPGQPPLSPIAVTAAVASPVAAAVASPPPA